MTKKKKIMILVFVLIIFILVGVIIFAPTNKPKTYKSRDTKMCENITNDIKNKKDFIMLFKFETDTLDSEITVDDIIKNYPKSTIYTLNEEDANKECINKLFSHTEFYIVTLESKLNTFVVYKDGKYNGMIAGLDSYHNAEEFLESKGVIEKPVIKEEHTVEEFKDNAEEKDKYLILFMTDEKKRSTLESLLEKYFSGYNYDVVNINSETGEKLREDIEKKYGTLNEYPRMLYFENGKLILSDDAYDEFTIKLYKENLDKMNQQ